MTKIEHYHRPKTVQEASELLVASGNHGAIVAGSTSITIRRPSVVTTLVDLSRVGLDKIVSTPTEVTIGAMTPLSTLVSHPEIQGLYDGVLSDAASMVGSSPLRNRITLGGNAIQVLPWSDLPGVLIALKARFHFEGRKSQVVEAAKFYEQHPSKTLEPGDILTSIEIPRPTTPVRATYHKEAKTRFDYAALTVTTVCWFDANTVSDARVTYGSIRPMPVRSTEAESELVGRVPTADDIVRAAARASGAIDPSQDYRYSKEYRSRLLKVWTKRCLTSTLSPKTKVEA